MDVTVQWGNSFNTAVSIQSGGRLRGEAKEGMVSHRDADSRREAHTGEPWIAG